MKEYLLIKNQNLQNAKLINNDTVNVSIEGIPLKATCTHFLVKDSFIKGKNKERELIVNYLVVPLRNKFICCIISYYKEGSIHPEVPVILNPITAAL